MHAKQLEIDFQSNGVAMAKKDPWGGWWVSAEAAAPVKHYRRLRLSSAICGASSDCWIEGLGVTKYCRRCIASRKL